MQAGHDTRFSSMLQHRRAVAGLTQEELAERAGISVRAISDLERGVKTRPRPHTVRQLADALELSPADRASFLEASRTDRVPPVETFAPNGPAPDAGAGSSHSPHLAVVPLPSISRRRTRSRLADRRILAGAVVLAVLLLSLSLAALRIWHGPAGHADTPSGVIAYVKLVHAIPQIFTKTLPNGPERQLTRFPAGASAPVWSPDGKQLTFSRPQTPSPGSPTATELYVMWADGTGAHRLTQTDPLLPTLDMAYAWSPAGQRLVFERMSIQNMSVQRVYTMNADGTGMRRLISTTGYNAAPTWSPNGKLIAFESDRGGKDDIYTMRPDGSGVSRITDNSGFNEHPAWSPDGTRIAFFSNWKGQGIYVMRADGSEGRKLASTAQVAAPVWSNDGRWILFAGDNASSSGSLFAVHADGSGVQQVARGDVSMPAWDPRPPAPAPARPHPLFNQPTGIAIDGNGDVFVANIAPAGVPGFVEELTPAGMRVAIQRLNGPRGVTLGRGGDLFLTNQGPNELVKLSPRLHTEDVWAVGPGGQIEGVLVDRQGNVVVTDAKNDQIDIFTPRGRLLRSFGQNGMGPGEFNGPSGIAADRAGNLYITEVANGSSRVQEVSASGKPIRVFGIYGGAPGQFDTPYGIAVDREGFVYVADTNNNRVQKLSPRGKVMAIWTNLEGTLNLPAAVALDRAGNVYVADTGNNRVIKLTPAGRVLNVYR